MAPGSFAGSSAGTDELVAGGGLRLGFGMIWGQGAARAGGEEDLDSMGRPDPVLQVGLI